MRKKEFISIRKHQLVVMNRFPVQLIQNSFFYSFYCSRKIFPQKGTCFYQDFILNRRNTPVICMLFYLSCDHEVRSEPVCFFFFYKYSHKFLLRNMSYSRYRILVLNITDTRFCEITVLLETLQKMLQQNYCRKPKPALDGKKKVKYSLLHRIGNLSK